MASSVHLVFSEPPAEVSRSSYDAWYDRHVEEIVSVPGFQAARRYWLEPIVGDRPPTMYRHLALYELTGESGPALAALDRRMERGELTLEPWFERIRFASFDGLPLEAADVEAPDHLYLVFSKPPERIGFEQYSDWYATHLR